MTFTPSRASRRADGRPLVVAHRGNSRAFPENTFAAFDAAVMAGADGIELDLQLSRDGVPVVFHDKTLRRHHGDRSKIHHLTLAELRELDFGSWFHEPSDRQPIPTLDEVLDRYGRHTTLMLELKTDTDRDAEVGFRNQTLVKSVLAAVRRHRLRKRVWILAFQEPVLRLVRKNDPHIQCALGFSEPIQPTRVLMRTLSPYQAVLLPGRNVSASLMQRVHAANKQTLVYRCDTARVALRAARHGATALMADDPVWLENFLDSFFRSRPRG